MALLVDCAETIIGIPMVSTYARITGFQGDKNYIMITIDHFANEQARHNNAQAIATRTYTAPVEVIDGGFSGIYEWLKQNQAEYFNAVDC